MRVAIVDDEKSEQDLLEKYLREWAGQKKRYIEMIKFESAESFLFSWEEDKKYDLLLLDIEMREINGLVLAEKIRMDDEQIPIVFVTGYDEYMQYGYDVSALHYLIKPVNKTKLFMVLDKLQEKQEVTDKILISTSDGQRSVMAGKIMYVEAFGHRCILHLMNENVTIKESIGAFEKMIEGKSCFIKCHRAYIVNLQYVSRVLKTDIILDNDEKVPVSRNQLKRVQEAFIRNYGINRKE